jgi:hypothetical protein
MNSDPMSEPPSTDQHIWGRMLYELLPLVGKVCRVTVKPLEGEGTSYASIMGILRTASPLLAESAVTDAEDVLMQFDGGTVGISRAEFTGYEWDCGALRVDTELLSVWIER